MMSCALGLALGAPVAAAAAGANPNLLLWSEALDNAVWAKTNCIVLADQNATADEMQSTSVSAACRQITTTAAATGGPATATVGPHGAFTRDSVTETFDGLPYTFSIESRDAGGSESITLRIDRSGGFIRCSIEEEIGDGDALIRFMQLEQAGAFTTYHFRGGT